MNAAVTVKRCGLFFELSLSIQRFCQSFPPAILHRKRLCGGFPHCKYD